MPSPLCPPPDGLASAAAAATAANRAADNPPPPPCEGLRGTQRPPFGREGGGADGFGLAGPFAVGK